MGNDEFLDQDMTARKCVGDRPNMAMLTSPKNSGSHILVMCADCERGCAHLQSYLRIERIPEKTLHK